MILSLLGPRHPDNQTKYLDGSIVSYVSHTCKLDIELSNKKIPEMCRGWGYCRWSYKHVPKQQNMELRECHIW
jgi:hypothetical protein